MLRPVFIAFLDGAMGPGELVVIFLAVLLLFGPKRLPEIARSIGKIVNDLRRASQDFHDEVMRMDQEPPAVLRPQLPPATPPPEDAVVVNGKEAAPDAGKRAPPSDEAEPTAPEPTPNGKAPDDLAG